MNMNMNMNMKYEYEYEYIIYVYMDTNLFSQLGTLNEMDPIWDEHDMCQTCR